MAHDARRLRDQLVSPWPWHRWLGVVAAALLVWSGITGIVLVHADDLGLARAPVRQAWILDLFGVPLPEVEVGFATPAGWVAQVDDRAFLSARPLPPQLGVVDAVVVDGDQSWVHGDQGAVLLDRDGAPIELMAGDEDPGLAAPHPVDAQRLPDAEAAVIAAAARSLSLDWEQVVRVLHGSHGGGPWGPLLADLSALALIVLSLTGVVMFLQRRAHERARAGERPADEGSDGG